MKMKACSYATISMNGYIADNGFSEDVFDEIELDGDISKDINWREFAKLAHKYGNAIYGRKTFLELETWEECYLDSLDGIDIYVISSTPGDSTRKNVHYYTSLEEVLELLESKNTKPFIIGGATLNTYAFSHDYVDEIIFNFNAALFGKGINYINEIDCVKRFKIASTKLISDEIIQIHFKEK